MKIDQKIKEKKKELKMKLNPVLNLHTIICFSYNSIALLLYPAASTAAVLAYLQNTYGFVVKELLSEGTVNRELATS